MEKEAWKPIKGFESYYEISNYGRVKSLTRYIENNRGSTTKIEGKILKPSMNKIGYPSYQLRNKTTVTAFYEHKLVALHFIKNPKDYTHVNHIDNIKTNNYFENLEWCTQKHNVLHARSLDLLATGNKAFGAKLCIEKVKEIKKLLKEKKLNQREIACIYGVDPSTISNINTNKRWNYELSKCE